MAFTIPRVDIDTLIQQKFCENGQIQGCCNVKVN